MNAIAHRHDPIREGRIIVSGSRQRALDTFVCCEQVRLKRPKGVEGFLQWHGSAFRDVQSTIEDMIAAGDKVVVRTTSRSRYHGGWRDIPGAGQAVVETGISIYRIAEGTIREV